MPSNISYKDTMNNSYLNKLLKRYDERLWITHPDSEVDSFLAPSGVKASERIIINSDGAYFYRELFRELTNTDTRRWLFDSDQAVEFSQLGMNPAQDDGSEAISPFPRFYMEFTNPLTGVVAEEPGYQDATVALVFRENVAELTSNEMLVEMPTTEITLSSATFFLQTFAESKGNVHNHIDGIHNPIMTIESNKEWKEEGWVKAGDQSEGTYYSDRTFKIHLPTGQAWVTPILTTDRLITNTEAHKEAMDSGLENKLIVEGEQLVTEGVDGGTDWFANQEILERMKSAVHRNEQEYTSISSELPEEWLEPENLLKFYPAGVTIKGMEDRQIGYWETITQQYCDMLVWILMYIQSKQIETISVMPQRSERRRLQKKGEVPRPWHVLRINPKLVVNLNQTEGSKTGATHGHIYDVRAHWRRQTIRYGPKRQLTKRVTQYIPSHMRGLKNEIYVPKTRKMENQNEDT